MNLYVDGVLISSNRDKWVRSETGANIYLGSHRGNDFADAVIDELKIYDSTLNADEIRARYLGKLTDELGDACDPCPKDPSNLCKQAVNDDDNDGVLNEDDLCSDTKTNDYDVDLTKTDGCSCEQIKEALAAGGKGYAKGVFSDKNLGICRAAQAGAKGILAKTGKAFGFGETSGAGLYAIIAVIILLSVIYLLVKRKK